MRAEGAGCTRLRGAGVATRRPVKREQPSRVRERVKHAFASQTDNSLPSCLPVIRKCAAFTLAEVFHPAEQSKRTAFTLAEVLITLGIIGVVAALTMPSLISSYRKKVYSTRLKEAYSILSQAVKLSEIDNGPTSTWVSHPMDNYDENGDYSDEKNAKNCNEFFMTYLAPYMRYSNNQKDINNRQYRLPNGVTFGLHNGSVMDIYVKVGYAKKELGMGRDVHYFRIGSNGFGVAYGTSASRNWYKNMCKTTPSYCTALLMIDNWEFKDDYPLKF